MDSGRPLHEVFDALSRGALDDPVAALRDAGHDLPADLVGDALAHYADTADVAVAEHLAPFVTAHTAGEDVDPAEGLSLLASTPAGDIDDLDAVAPEPGETLGIAFGAGSDDLDFGSGAADGGETAEAVDVEPFLPMPEAEPVEIGEGMEDMEDTDVEALPHLFGSGSPDEADAEETDLDG